LIDVIIFSDIQVFIFSSQISSVAIDRNIEHTKTDFYFNSNTHQVLISHDIFIYPTTSFFLFNIFVHTATKIEPEIEQTCYFDSYTTSKEDSDIGVYVSDKPEDTDIFTSSEPRCNPWPPRMKVLR